MPQNEAITRNDSNDFAEAPRRAYYVEHPAISSDVAVRFLRKTRRQSAKNCPKPGLVNVIVAGPMVHI